MITAEHIRRLLTAEEPDATLVIVGGEPKITSSPAAEGGLVVADREYLMQGRDTLPDDAELERLAQVLNTTVSELGG